MLEEGMKKREAPTPPNPYIVFTFSDFKDIFKIYCEEISAKAKQMRSKFVWF